MQAPTVGGLFRIGADDADALGLDAPALPQRPGRLRRGPRARKTCGGRLKQCYDPEIPVNIVDLGLVYDLTLAPMRGGAPGPGASVHGQREDDAHGPRLRHGPGDRGRRARRILAVPGVASADVLLVWDPPWSADMATPEGRRVLGM